jgi:hypothetical protein
VQDGDRAFDAFLVLFDEAHRLAGFGPGLGRVAEDEEDVGDDVQFVAPADEIVKVLHLDVFADDVVADAVGPGFQAEGEVE